MDEVILWLVGIGLIAGFIDSIAGGGGLITVPSLILALGPGALAIGTNKIAGSLAAFVALIVYASKGHFDWKKSVVFSLWVSLGAFTGSRISPLFPLSAFKWLLFLTCPLILWIVWKKDLWVEREMQAHSHTGKIRFNDPALICCGFACGLYDGMWGPGGGTFMFLSLLFMGKLPLLVALAASKLANTVSATSAFLGYWQAGYVKWPEGLSAGLGVSIGAFIGAGLATRRAKAIVRPVLVVVALILLARLFWS